MHLFTILTLLLKTYKNIFKMTICDKLKGKVHRILGLDNSKNIMKFQKLPVKIVFVAKILNQN